LSYGRSAFRQDDTVPGGGPQDKPGAGLSVTASDGRASVRPSTTPDSCLATSASSQTPVETTPLREEYRLRSAVITADIVEKADGIAGDDSATGLMPGSSGSRPVADRPPRPRTNPS